MLSNFFYILPPLRQSNSIHFERFVAPSDDLCGQNKCHHRDQRPRIRLGTTLQRISHNRRSMSKTSVRGYRGGGGEIRQKMGKTKNCKNIDFERFVAPLDDLYSQN